MEITTPRRLWTSARSSANPARRRRRPDLPLNPPYPVIPMNARRRRALRLEVLETRFTPAVTVVNNHLATFTDVDGDHVSITVSKGDLHDVDFVTAPAGVGEQLQTLDLLDLIVGANLTSRRPAAGGDGLSTGMSNRPSALWHRDGRRRPGTDDAKEPAANGVALARSTLQHRPIGCDTGPGVANLTSNIVGRSSVNVTGDLVMHTSRRFGDTAQ